MSNLKNSTYNTKYKDLGNEQESIVKELILRC